MLARNKQLLIATGSLVLALAVARCSPVASSINKSSTDRNNGGISIPFIPITISIQTKVLDSSSFQSELDRVAKSANTTPGNGTSQTAGPKTLPSRMTDDQLQTFISSGKLTQLKFDSDIQSGEGLFSIEAWDSEMESHYMAEELGIMALSAHASSLVDIDPNLVAQFKVELTKVKDGTYTLAVKSDVSDEVSRVVRDHISQGALVLTLAK